VACGPYFAPSRYTENYLKQCQFTVLVAPRHFFEKKFNLFRCTFWLNF
jgi:hypothetical protein